MYFSRISSVFIMLRPKKSVQYRTVPLTFLFNAPVCVSLHITCLSFNLFYCRFLPGRGRVNCGDTACLHLFYIFLVEGQWNSCSSFQASRRLKAWTSCAVPERIIVASNDGIPQYFPFLLHFMCSSLQYRTFKKVTLPLCGIFLSMLCKLHAALV